MEARQKSVEHAKISLQQEFLFSQSRLPQRKSERRIPMSSVRRDDDEATSQSLRGRASVDPSKLEMQLDQCAALSFFPHQAKVSSAELRKMPMDILLQPARELGNDISSFDVEDEEDTMRYKGKLSLLRRIFLNPNHTLSTQMMVSFGLINFLTIVFVVFICTLVAFRTGNKMKSVQVETFDRFTQSSLSITARYLAESLDQRLMPVDVVDIIYEATQDRFLGGFQESDEHVPFPDMITEENIYPVIGPDLFLDWQVPRTVNESNFEEHLQVERWSFYQHKSAVSTESCVFAFQGACDPEAPDDSPFYWENCTESSNDISIGGSYNPSNVTSIVYRKSKDLVPVLKAVFEAHHQVRDLGLFFMAEGNGASIYFPAYPLDTKTSYTSMGCEWMMQPNPFDPKRPIGTTNEISRCHQKGQSVSNRVYNPMERGWCQEQALNPSKVLVHAEDDDWSPDSSHLFLGRAIYDRLTKDFLACVYVGISLDDLSDFLKENRVTENSHVSIARFHPAGEIVSSSIHDRGDEGTDEPTGRTIEELDIGVTSDSFRELISLVNFSGEWNATNARDAYENIVIEKDGFVVYAYPIPPVPPAYDPDYTPEFLVLVSVSDDDMLRSVRQVDSSVQETVLQLITFSCVLGLVGLLVTTLIVYTMARALTAPLDDMNEAAQEIIDSFGAVGTKEDKNRRAGRTVRKSTGLCSPKTELHDVVCEYNKMVANFSGSLMAKSQKKRQVEIKNPFTSQGIFGDLYQKMKANPFIWKAEAESTVCLFNMDASLVNHSPPSAISACGAFIHSGRNAMGIAISKNLVLRKEVSPKKFSSPLFWWTVALIVVPLLMFTITISSLVMFRLQKEFNQNVDFAKDYYFGIVLDALQLHSTLRAQAVASSSSWSIRDLYLANRYFGWLLFGGLQSAGSFTKMYSGADECKFYSNSSECPYVQAHGYCHCSWNDPRSVTFGCTDDTSEDPRHRQLAFFTVQSSDALDNGNRTFSSFPRVDYLPNTTAWWDDPLTMPGYNWSRSISGFETLYDRLRLSSAMPLFPPLYSYDKKKESQLTNYLAFEADGLFLGFRNCPGFSHLHRFQSSAANQAFMIRPELCPEGKFGFDPRCREWYDTGRKLARQQGLSLYVTAPYAFSSGTFFAQSATSPLMDPVTGEHVAQMLVDFKITNTFRVLAAERTRLTSNGFPVLISVQGDREENTVIGPDFDINGDARKISQVILPYDYDCLTDNCQQNMNHFLSIESKMKNGESGVAKFDRASASGSLETIHIAYAPVTARSIRPLDPSDFSRGVLNEGYQVYSIGLCETEQALLEPFSNISDEVDRQVIIAVAIITAAIALALVVIVYVSYVMTSFISEPMFYLLDLIRCINKMSLDEDPPSVARIVGPREIISVSITLETLYKVVRAANDAFSSGEIEKAYYVLSDALRLFKKLGNQKAIGVASNNLGNLMTVLYRKLKDSPDRKEICGLTVQDIIEHGMNYFFDAIRLGEKAYDDFYNREGWTSNCLDFMQHLANRYFNRALFLLTVVGDHTSPIEIEMLAIRDLEIARDMDLEIIAYRDDVGLSRDKETDKLFHLGIARAQAHNMLFDLGYPDDLMKAKGYPEHWNLPHRFKEMFEIVVNQKNREGSTLFDEVTEVGRRQSLERELIRYLMRTGDVQSAAITAIRMLVEDEFVFADSVVIAIDALRNYVDHADMNSLQRIQAKRDLQECKKAVYRSVFEYLEDESKSPTLMRDRCDDLTVVSKSLKVGRSMSMPVEDLSLVLWICEHACGGFVTMENF